MSAITRANEESAVSECLSPIYYHALDFPTNCTNPWALRFFVKELVQDLKQQDGDVPPIYPVNVDGYITQDPAMIDSRARCVAMVVTAKPEERKFLVNWPVISLALAMGYRAGTPEYDNVKDQDMVYMTADLAECVIDQLRNPDEEV